MACRRFGVKPLLEPMMTYCPLDLQEPTSAKLDIYVVKIVRFLFKIMYLRISSAKWQPFVSQCECDKPFCPGLRSSITTLHWGARQPLFITISPLYVCVFASAPILVVVLQVAQKFQPNNASDGGQCVTPRTQGHVQGHRTCCVIFFLLSAPPKFSAV